MAPATAGIVMHQGRSDAASPGPGREATGVGGAGLAVALSGLAQASGLLGVPEVAEQATEAARRLAALTLEVAVVGEFKRGKSSLINALLGREVLPVGVLPLTAVPTVLERGVPGCVVEFADGRRDAHHLAQVGRFVTEEANPGNALGVARVVVRLPAPLLDQGVRLVDTPGVGSVHGHNTLATGTSSCPLDPSHLVASSSSVSADSRVRSGSARAVWFCRPCVPRSRCRTTAAGASGDQLNPGQG